MEDKLITTENIVEKKKLYDLGFCGNDLCNIINNNILKKIDKNHYVVLDLNKFKILLLNKLLDFDRTIITQEELNYFGLTQIEQKKLCSHRIVERIDDFRFRVIGKIDNLNQDMPEIDWFLYKQLYKESLSLKDLESAQKYMEKYISFCELLNFEGDYYYKLSMLRNDIDKSKLTSKELTQYSNLIKKYKTFIYRKQYEKALTMAHRCYDINPGAMEAIRIAKIRLLLNKKDTDIITEYLVKAKEKDKTNPLIYKYMAQVYLKKEDYKKSIYYLNEYFSLDKNTNYDYYSSLFGVYLKINDISAAYKLFSDAIFIVHKKQLTLFIGECLKLVKNNISEELKLHTNSTRLTELNCLKISLTKELGHDIDVFSEKEEENIKYTDLENEIQLLLEPDCNNIVDLKKIDKYISNLEVPLTEKNLIILRSGLILANNNYFKKAKEYIEMVEKNNTKSELIIEELNNTRRELKLIKNKKRI